MGWQYSGDSEGRSFLRRVPPAVGVVTILLMAPLGYAALASLGKGAGLAVAAAVASGLVTTLFVYLFLSSGNTSRSQVESYLWGRLGMALVAAVVATLILHFLPGWPWLVAAAAGPAAGVVLLEVGVIQRSW